jgi:hypothetical protein
MKISDATRRRAIAATAQPTPRALGGRVLNIDIPLYPAGHCGIKVPGSPKASMMLNDDRELIEQIALIIREVRDEMKMTNDAEVMMEQVLKQQGGLE